MTHEYEHSPYCTGKNVAAMRRSLTRENCPTCRAYDAGASDELGAILESFSINEEHGIYELGYHAGLIAARGDVASMQVAPMQAESRGNERPAFCSPEPSQTVQRNGTTAPETGIAAPQFPLSDPNGHGHAGRNGSVEGDEMGARE